MRNKLKSLSFSRVSQVTLGPFSGILLLRFGHEIMCFAVAHVPQSQALCDWRVCWPQDVANRQSKFLGSAAGRQPLNKKIKHLKSISNIWKAHQNIWKTSRWGTTNFPKLFHLQTLPNPVTPKPIQATVVRCSCGSLALPAAWLALTLLAKASMSGSSSKPDALGGMIFQERRIYIY